MGFEINPKKTKICPQGQQQIVTGIVVNEKAQVPKTYRRNLRQEIYYIEKFGLSEHLAHIHLDLTPEKYLEHVPDIFPE